MASNNCNNSVVSTHKQETTVATSKELGFITDKPKFPQYAQMARRKESFGSTWPSTNPVCVTDLVAAGLVYTGEIWEYHLLDCNTFESLLTLPVCLSLHDTALGYSVICSRKVLYCSNELFIKMFVAAIHCSAKLTNRCIAINFLVHSTVNVCCIYG